MLISRTRFRVYIVAEAIRINLLSGGFVHDIGKYSFSNRVIDNWNQLSKDIVTCISVNSFRLDRFVHKREFTQVR